MGEDRPIEARLPLAGSDWLFHKTEDSIPRIDLLVVSNGQVYPRQERITINFISIFTISTKKLTKKKGLIFVFKTIMLIIFHAFAPVFKNNKIRSPEKRTRAILLY